MAVAPSETSEVVVARSEQEAVSAFGEGDDVLVVGGGTIVMVELVHGRLAPRRTLMLHEAGLSGVRDEGGRTTIGAMTPLSELEDAAQPLATAVRHVADLEIRGQATLGGNLCAPPGDASPRGDLQAPLVALGAEVRSAGRGGERTEPLEDFLAAGPEGRLLLDVSFPAPEAGAAASVRRPHAHAYTVMAVNGARSDGAIRLAVTGAGPRAVRLRSVEEALSGGAGAEEAAARAVADVDPPDDALASAWYRRETLPVLVRRVLDDLS